MNARQLLRLLADKGAKITLAGDNLKINAPRGMITPAHSDALRHHKREIIKLLSAADQRRQQIEPVERCNELPLSFAQQRLWFINQLRGGDDISYNMPMAFRLQGGLNIAALRKALHTVVQRHEILRSRFNADNGRARQIITSQSALTIPLIQILSQDIDNYIDNYAVHLFDLPNGPLLKACLLRVSPRDHVFCINQHHIISDAWSVAVFYRELALLYSAYLKGRRSPLPELPIQYADFAHWQRQWLRGAVLQRQADYWQQQLRAAPTLLELPGDRPRPALQRYRGRQYRFQLTPTVTLQAKKLAREQGASLFMLLLAAFAMLLSRYSGQTDICIGTPIANRRRAELENLIGFFVNTLVLRMGLRKTDSAADFIQRVKTVALAAFEHQDIPFEQLLDILKPDRSLSHTPLFQVMFSLQNAARPLFQLPGVTTAPVEGEFGIAKFDLSLFLLENGDTIGGTLEYNTDLFDRSTIARFSKHYQALLENLCNNPRQPLASLPLLGASEYRQLLLEWNNTGAHYPRDQCLHTIFESRASQCSDAIALVFEDTQLTYGQLNRKSNQLARYLVEQGIKPETRVGLCLQRSAEMIIGLLGILKAGGCYVPIDPDYPQQRVRYMLADSDISWLLTQQDLLLKAADQPQLQHFCVDSDWWKIADYDPGDTAISIGPTSLAYVIYTSGSTGKPKGVAVSHRAVNRLAVNNRYIDLSAKRRLLQAASIAFDAATFEIWAALLNGHPCVLYPEQTINAAKLEALINRQAVDTLWLTAALFNMIVDERPEAIKRAKDVLTGGEAVSADHVRKAYEHCPALRIVNGYGPTENTTFTTCYPIAREHVQHLPTVPIGMPISNTTTYILDTELNPVPIGVIGELYTGGEGLARGYLNRPDLTAENFIPNPFSQEPGERLYKTGDLVRHLPDGNIEFSGRIDQQVKIRGFRIELGEIEQALTTQPGVREAVVTAGSRSGKPGHHYLAAYIVCDRAGLTQSTLQQALKSQLPDYMIPACFIFLDKLPLNANGKVDRKRLPGPDRDLPASRRYIAPRSALEKKLATIWSGVLNLPVEKIGLQDNFFELGGDSILSIQVASRAYKQGISISTRLLFEHQTIEQLAQHVENAAQSIPQAPSRGDMPLLPVQLWFLNAGDAGRNHFHQSFLLHTPAGFDRNFLRSFVEAIINRHDALRLQFYLRDGQWRARFVPFSSSMVDKAVIEEKLPGTEVEQRAYLMARGSHVKASLNIGSAPLLRAVYFKTQKHTDCRLLLVIHHLVVDGISWRILLDDLAQAFGQWQSARHIALAPKSSPYQQWARDLCEYSRSDKLTAQRAYWLTSLSQTPPAPPATAGGLEDGSEQDTVFIQGTLNRTETEALLSQCHRAYQTRINDLLLSALLLAWQRWQGHASLRLRMESHGREPLFERADLSHTVGWFTALFPLTLHHKVDDPGIAVDLGKLIEDVKAQIRAVPENGIGYGILRYLAADRDIVAAEQDSRDDIVFNYLGQFDQQLGSKAVFTAATEFTGSDISGLRRRSAALGLTGSIIDSCLNVSMDYSRRQFDRAPLEALLREYIGALREIIRHCRSEVRHYPGIEHLPDAWLNLEFEGYSFRQKFEPSIKYGSDKTKPTLFLLPPGDGGVESYINLVECMRAGHNVCLLENIELLSGRYYSLPSLSEYYRNLIKREQPAGPYHIGGWSRGAILSHAVAGQLVSEGEPVDKTILIDPIGYTMDYTVIDNIRSDADVAKFDSVNLDKLNRLLHIYQYSRELGQNPYREDVLYVYANQGISVDEWAQDRQVFEVVDRHYRFPKKTAGSNRLPGNLESVFPNSEVLVLNATHHNLIQGDNMHTVARAIDTAMQGARA